MYDPPSSTFALIFEVYLCARHGFCKHVILTLHLWLTRARSRNTRRLADNFEALKWCTCKDKERSNNFCFPEGCFIICSRLRIWQCWHFSFVVFFYCFFSPVSESRLSVYLLSSSDRQVEWSKYLEFTLLRWAKLEKETGRWEGWEVKRCAADRK